MTAVLSNLVSNVPAVLLLKPFVGGLPDPATAWLVIAMASTLAGNFTVLGSIANLIVVEKAARRGVAIGFWDYFRVGAPLTVLTIALGATLAGAMMITAPAVRCVRSEARHQTITGHGDDRGNWQTKQFRTSCSPSPVA